MLDQLIVYSHFEQFEKSSQLLLRITSTEVSIYSCGPLTGQELKEKLSFLPSIVRNALLLQN